MRPTAVGEGVLSGVAVATADARCGAIVDDVARDRRAGVATLVAAMVTVGVQVGAGVTVGAGVSPAQDASPTCKRMAKRNGQSARSDGMTPVLHQWKYFK
jgi:hypothetical protein